MKAAHEKLTEKYTELQRQKRKYNVDESLKAQLKAFTSKLEVSFEDLVSAE